VVAAVRSAPLASLLPLLVLVTGCRVSDLDLQGKQCPCVTAWVCDEATNTCVPDPTFADARVDSRPGDPDANVDAELPPDARVDAVPGSTCIGPPGGVLFSDNFPDLIGWTTSSGTWAAPSGEAEQTNQSADLALVYPAGTTSFTDYRVKVLMHPLAGAGQDAMEVAFRVNGGNDEQYRCMWRPYFGTNMGRMDLHWIRSNGQRNAITGKTVDTTGIDPATPVEMEVLANGSSLTCCLIEIPAATITATDTRYSTGAPGIGTYQMSAAFDDFRVYMP
jgi:hypothetical protein